MWPALIMGAASMIGSYFSQQQTNQSNSDSAKYATDQSAIQAQKDRDFQAQMSNTAHQRETQDLEAAHLNPILSANGGNGASTPGGAMGQTTAFTGRTSPFQAAMSSANDTIGSALNLARQGVEMDNLRAQTGAYNQQVTSSRQTMQMNAAEAKKGSIGAKFLDAVQPVTDRITNSISSYADRWQPQQKLFWQVGPDGHGFYGPAKSGFSPTGSGGSPGM